MNPPDYSRHNEHDTAPSFSHKFTLALPYRMEGQERPNDADTDSQNVLHQLESNWMKKVPYMETNPFSTITVPRPLTSRMFDDSFAISFADIQQKEHYGLRAAAQTPVNPHAHRPMLSADGLSLDTIDFSACFPFDEFSVPIAIPTLQRIMASIQSQCTVPLRDPTSAHVTIVAGHKSTGKTTLLPPMLLYAFRHLSMHSGGPETQLCRTVFLVCHSTTRCFVAAHQIQQVLAQWGVASVGQETPYHESFPYQQAFARRKPRANVFVHTETIASHDLHKIYAESPEVNVVVCTPGAYMGYVENMSVDERSARVNAGLWGASLLIIDDADAQEINTELLTWMAKDLKCGAGALKRLRRIPMPVLLLTHVPYNLVGEAETVDFIEKGRISKLRKFFESPEALRESSAVNVRCDTIVMPFRFAGAERIEEENSMEGGLNVMDLESEGEDELSIPPLLPVATEDALDELDDSQAGHCFAAKLPLLEHCHCLGSEELNAAIAEEFKASELVSALETPIHRITTSFVMPVLQHLQRSITQSGPILILFPSDAAVTSFFSQFANVDGPFAVCCLTDTSATPLEDIAQISDSRTSPSTRRVIVTTHSVLQSLSRFWIGNERFVALIDTCRVTFSTSPMEKEKDIPAMERDAVVYSTRWATAQELNMALEFILAPLVGTPQGEEKDNDASDEAKPVVVLGLSEELDLEEVAKVSRLPRPCLPGALLRVLSYLELTRSDQSNGFPLRHHLAWSFHAIFDNLPLAPPPTGFSISAALCSLHVQGIICMQTKPSSRHDQSSSASVNDVESVFSSESTALLGLSAFGRVIARLYAILPTDAVFVRLPVAKLLSFGIMHRCVVSAAVFGASLVIEETAGSSAEATRHGTEFSDIVQKGMFWCEMVREFIQKPSREEKESFCDRNNISLAVVDRLVRLTLRLLAMLCECDLIQTGSSTTPRIEGIPIDAFQSEDALKHFNSHLISFDNELKRHALASKETVECPFVMCVQPQSVNRQSSSLITARYVVDLLAGACAEDSTINIELLRHLAVLAMYPNVCTLYDRGGRITFSPLSGAQIVSARKGEEHAAQLRERSVQFPSSLPPDGSILIFSHRLEHANSSVAESELISLHNATVAPSLSLIIAASNMLSGEVSKFESFTKNCRNGFSQVPLHRGWYLDERDHSSAAVSTSGVITSHAISRSTQTLYPLAQYVLTLDAFVRVVAHDKQIANSMMLLHLMHDASLFHSVCTPLEVNSSSTKGPLDSKKLSEQFLQAIQSLLSESKRFIDRVEGIDMNSIIIRDPFDAFVSAVDGKHLEETGEETLVHSIDAGQFVQNSCYTSTHEKSDREPSGEATAFHPSVLSREANALQQQFTFLAPLSRNLLALMERTIEYLHAKRKRSLATNFLERVWDNKCFSFLKHSSSFSPAVHLFYRFLAQKRWEKRLVKEAREKAEKTQTDRDESDQTVYTPPTHILLAHALTRTGKTPDGEGKPRQYCIDAPELNSILLYCDGDFHSRCLPSLYNARKRVLSSVVESFIATEEGDERKKTNALISAGLLKITPEMRTAMEIDEEKPSGKTTPENERSGVIDKIIESRTQSATIERNDESERFQRDLPESNRDSKQSTRDKPTRNDYTDEREDRRRRYREYEDADERPRRQARREREETQSTSRRRR